MKILGTHYLILSKIQVLKDSISSHLFLKKRKKKKERKERKNNFLGMPKNVQNKDTEDVFRLHLQKIKTIKMSPGQDLLLTIFISI